MKFTHLSLLATLITLSSLPGAAQAASFNPTTAAQLQSDLNTAAANGEDDTITLNASVYSTTDNGNATFLYNSAENNSLTLTGAGAGASILDGGGVAGGPTVLTITTSGPDTAIRISGVTIRNANTTGIGGLSVSNTNGAIDIQSSEVINNISTTNNGGMILTSIGGTITFNGNVLSGNTGHFDGGGRISSPGGSVVLNNNTISGNTGTTFQGGLIIATVSGGATADGNTVSGNRGNFDGGLTLVVDGDLSITNNTITDNTGTIFNGGLVAASNLGSARIEGNSFTNNVGNFNGGLSGRTEQDLTINDNIFRDNVATVFNGGISVFSQNSTATADRNLLTGNHGGFIGGANFGGQLGTTFSNNTVLNNSADLFTGGASISSNAGGVLFVNNIISGNTVDSTSNSSTPAGAGALVRATDGELNVINNTIVDNSIASTILPPQGGGLWVGADPSAVDVNLFNNIVFGNSTGTGEGEDIYIFFAPPLNGGVHLFNNDFTETCLDDGTTVNCDFAAVLGPDQGDNLEGVDPLFVDAANGNFQLSSNSPLIDAGTTAAPDLPATDHDGNPRVFNNEVDMGALEALASILVAPLALDFGTVNIPNSASQVVTITNQGTVALTVEGMDLSDNIRFAIDPNGGANPCGSLSFILEAGDNCTVLVLFQPDQAGSFDATLVINSNDPVNPALTVTLTGIALGGNLSGGGCSLTSGFGGETYLGILLIAGSLLLIRRGKKESTIG